MVTGGYKGLQRVTKGYKELQGVTSVEGLNEINDPKCNNILS